MPLILISEAFCSFFEESTRFSSPLENLALQDLPPRCPMLRGASWWTPFQPHKTSNEPVNHRRASPPARSQTQPRPVNRKRGTSREAFDVLFVFSWRPLRNGKRRRKKRTTFFNPQLFQTSIDQGSSQCPMNQRTGVPPHGPPPHWIRKLLGPKGVWYAGGLLPVLRAPAEREAAQRCEEALSPLKQHAVSVCQSVCLSFFLSFIKIKLFCLIIIKSNI